MNPRNTPALVTSLLGLALIALGAASCNRAEADAGQPASSSPTVAAAAPAPAAVDAAAPRDPNCGYYVGMFIAEEMNDRKNPMWENKINVALDWINGEQVTGHSVVAGNNRPFTGTLKPAGQDQFQFSFELREPGDDKYDGVFTGTLDASKHTLTGFWTANDKKLAVTKRSYELTRTEFKYNPNQDLLNIPVEVYSSRMDEGHHRGEAITEDAGKYNASVKLLKSKDVDNLYKRDLEVMRNAIYARHGYSFQNREMRHFFDESVDWYIPVSTDITAELTAVEKQNIELLKRYEKHAASYYDSFGR